jgi:hypothetical protein
MLGRFYTGQGGENAMTAHCEHYQDGKCTALVCHPAAICLKLQSEHRAYEQERQARQEAEKTLTEIRGIVGFPGTIALSEAGLSESLPDVVRYTHRQWLEQTHAAGQRFIQEQMRADKAEAEARGERARAEQLAIVLATLGECAYAPGHDEYRADNGGYDCVKHWMDVAKERADQSLSQAQDGGKPWVTCPKCRGTGQSLATLDGEEDKPCANKS